MIIGNYNGVANRSFLINQLIKDYLNYIGSEYAKEIDLNIKHTPSALDEVIKKYKEENNLPIDIKKLRELESLAEQIRQEKISALSKQELEENTYLKDKDISLQDISSLASDILYLAEEIFLCLLIKQLNKIEDKNQILFEQELDYEKGIYIKKNKLGKLEVTMDELYWDFMKSIYLDKYIKLDAKSFFNSSFTDTQIAISPNDFAIGPKPNHNIKNIFSSVFLELNHNKDYYYKALLALHKEMCFHAELYNIPFKTEVNYDIVPNENLTKSLHIIKR